MNSFGHTVLERTEKNGLQFADAYMKYIALAPHSQYNMKVKRPNRTLNASGDTAYIIFPRNKNNKIVVLTTQIDYNDKLISSENDTLREFDSEEMANSFVERLARVA